MDSPATSHTTPPPASADVPDQGHDDPPQSLDRLPVSVVAQRQIMKADAVGSPVRRSPRLSCLPPPQPPTERQDTSSDDESESINDVALYLSREDTPENVALPPDEPSTVLANRILRASDNPSPPPQHLAHPVVNYAPGNDGHSPSHAVSAPLTPFRPINFLERLNQPSYMSFNLSPSTPTSGDRPDSWESSVHPPRGFISPGLRSPFIASMPMKSIPHEDLESAYTSPSSSNHDIADNTPLQSSQHVRLPACFADDAIVNSPSHLAAGPHEKSITTTSSLDSEAFSSSPVQAIAPSSNLVTPPALDASFGEPRQQGCLEHSLLVPDTTTLSSNEDASPSLTTDAMISGGKDDDAEKDSILSVSERVNVNLGLSLDFLSPRSTNISPEPIEQHNAYTEPISIGQTQATPPRTPKPSTMHPDLSRSTVQRPAVAPTPVRAKNGAWKLISPAKFSSGADDTCRTPAQRVPIENVLARGTPSFQKTIQFSTGSDHAQRFPAIRGLVFTRPALDDQSRSPAKRVPVTNLAASPMRGNQGQYSPSRFDHRARSASIEPRPLRPIPPRSRSVEPGFTTPKPDGHETLPESIFPTVPILPRSGTKLPFPLVPGQKSSSDLPPPILEENAETRNTGTDATLDRFRQCTVSQLRQQSANSRIPRIGNKPYARPPSRNGKGTEGTTSVYTTRAPTASTFQLTSKNNAVGNNNTEVPPTNSVNGLRLVGSLKRKRGPEGAAPSNLHSVMVRQVVPGILNGKYAVKPAKIHPPVQAPSESSPLKATQPLKFRKVVDGMLSARYAPAKANLPRTELSDSTLLPPSPLLELALSSDEEPSERKHSPPSLSGARCESETSVLPCDAAATKPSPYDHSSLHQGSGEPSSRPRRTSRARKAAQQQYVLDVFNDNSSSRPPPARRKPQPRMESNGFMGMSATALKALTTSNTTRNQQTVAVLATEVIRKEGLRPESPTVKARTILQKQRDERDMRRRERAQRKVEVSEERLKTSDTEGLGDPISLNRRADHDENDCGKPQKHRRGPGDEEEYETPERPERIIESLRLEETDGNVRPVKQVKWHRELSTAVYVDEIDPKLKPLLKNVVVRGCLAPTSKNLSLDPLGNLVDIDNRPSPELVTEHITVKKYLYDDDIEPEPIPAKMTRSKSKKSKS